jgi:hypothetical protein
MRRAAGGQQTPIRRSAAAAGVPRLQRRHAAAARRISASKVLSMPGGRTEPAHRRHARKRRFCRCNTRNPRYGQHDPRADRPTLHVPHSGHATHGAARRHSPLRSRRPSPAASRPRRYWPRSARAPARRRARAQPASAQCVADRPGSWYKAGSRPRMVRIGRCVRKATARPRVSAPAPRKTVIRFP